MWVRSVVRMNVLNPGSQAPAQEVGGQLPGEVGDSGRRGRPASLGDTRQSIVKSAGGGRGLQPPIPTSNYPRRSGWTAAASRSSHGGWTPSPPAAHLQTAAYRSPINSARWLIPRHYSPVDDDVIDAAIKVLGNLAYNQRYVWKISSRIHV